jgi:hypothetical protein
MSILQFLYEENSETASWLADGVKTEIRDVRQAVFDKSHDLVLALYRVGTSSRLQIFNKSGLAGEIVAPGNSDFQYLLPDNSKGVLIICSDISDAGTFDWKYELALPDMQLKKIGRTY